MHGTGSRSRAGPNMIASSSSSITPRRRRRPNQLKFLAPSSNLSAGRDLSKRLAECIEPQEFLAHLDRHVRSPGKPFANLVESLADRRQRFVGLARLLEFPRDGI